MTQDVGLNRSRRNFLKSAASAAVTGGLTACGGGSDEEVQNHTKYGFYLGHTGADGLRDLAKFDAAVVHPNYILPMAAKTAGIKKSVAYGSLIAIEGSANNIPATDLGAHASKKDWLLKNQNGFKVNVPGAEGPSAAVIDIRIPAAYEATKSYLTGLINLGYGGIYLDGLDRAVSLVNADPSIAGLTEATVKLMNEVSEYAKTRGKGVMVAAAFTQPQTGTLNPLVEAMKAADTTVVPQIFSATDDYEEFPQKNTAARSAALTAAAKASGKKDVEIVGVEIARDPAKKLCDTLAGYDALTKDSSMHYSVFFDRPLLNEPPHRLPPLPGDITYLQPRKLELTRPEIIAANAALIEHTKQPCAVR